jgi:hypothetical protein
MSCLYRLSAVSVDFHSCQVVIMHVGHLCDYHLSILFDPNCKVRIKLQIGEKGRLNAPFPLHNQNKLLLVVSKRDLL